MSAELVFYQAELCNTPKIQDMTYRKYTNYTDTALVSIFKSDYQVGAFHFSLRINKLLYYLLLTQLSSPLKSVTEH